MIPSRLLLKTQGGLLVPRKEVTQEEVQEVQEVFKRFIRDLYEGLGWEIPDEFYPEKEVPRILALLKE